MAGKLAPKGIRPFEDFYAALETAKPASYPRSRVRAPSGFEAQKAHLLDLYRGAAVRHSFQDSAGQIFDCIPRDEQPALGGRPLATPPDVPRTDGPDPPAVSPPLLGEGRWDDHGNVMQCPEGCVAVRRLTLDELTRFEGLPQFLKKRPRGADRRRIPDEPAEIPAAGGAGHAYAHARQSVDNLGCSAVLNVWAPPVEDAALFSVSQLWLGAGPPDRVQTVEAGWHVYPERYGHSRPVLFSYWTADGYVDTGSYNTDLDVFVQYGAKRPLGIALDRTSARGGVQTEIQVSYLFADDAWWLFVGGTEPDDAVGYYPASLFGEGPMAKHATSVVFGGETSTRGAFPPMGSGVFAARGYRQAAYQRNLAYYDGGGGLRQADLRPRQSSPAMYTIEAGNAQDWGEYIFFGGPGGG